MKISIVTPSYNQGRFIERALKSVADQKGVNFEHVIYDGGSTDNTIEILKSFSPSIRWISEKDKGQTDAVNKGISTTDGEIIGWLNSDDIFYPNAFSEVIKFLENNSDVDVVYGMADHIDINDRILEPYPTEPWDFQRLKDTCFICQPALFFRRRIVAKYGLLDSTLNYCMDYEYWLRLGRAGVRFVYLEEKIAGSRLYAETKTIGNRLKVHHEINDMFRKKFGEVPERWLFNYAHVMLEGKLNREDQPLLYKLLLVLLSIWCVFHWRTLVPKRYYVTIIHWLKGILK